MYMLIWHKLYLSQYCNKSMFVERAHSYILKDIMAGIYWLVELRPGASAEIISVCN